MTKEKLEQLEQLWQQALKLEPQQRENFVKEAAVTAEIRAEILTMLKYESASEEFLENHAIEDVARDLANDQQNFPQLPQPGERLGDYEIISHLGTGGMGSVFLARDVTLQRPVAVKILPAHFAFDSNRVKRFRREAEMLAKISHPNVATLLDYDREQTTFPRFLVMEYVPGETLAARLEKGALPAIEAVPIFRQIAEALQAAHRQNVIHRDLKPSNIKITSDGIVKILDFGLAKAAPISAAIANPASSASPTLTQARMVIGTPGYMSPEQLRGEKNLDQRADFWAFGVVLYEALTGKHPFKTLNSADTQAAILMKEPDWKALPLDTPLPLITLMRRCLRKDLSRRLPNAEAAIRLLNEVPENSWRTKLKTSLYRVAPGLAIIAIIFAVVLLAYFSVRWLDPKPATILAITAENAIAPCPQNEIIVNLLSDKLRALPGLGLTQKISGERNQAFLMIDPLLTQTALTQDATTILKIRAADCSGNNQSVDYSIVTKQGKVLATGVAGDLNQLLMRVAGTLELKAEAATLQATPQEQQYYRALLLLEHYVNENSIDDAIASLDRLLNDKSYGNQLEEARIRAALSWGSLLKSDYADKQGNRSKAISLCDQAKNLAGEDPDVLLRCGKIAILLSNFNQAIASFEKVLTGRKDDPEALLGLANSYRYKKDDRNAEIIYRRGIQANPRSWQILNEQGGFYFERGEFKEAENAWRRVAEILDSNPFGYSNLSAALMYQEKYAEAIQACTDALKRKPLIDAYQNSAMAYLYWGKCDEAVDSLNAGLKKYPEDARLWGTMADVCACSIFHRREAAPAYSKAIALIAADDPGRDPDSLSLLAEWQARKGDLKAATRNIETVLQAAPENFDFIVSAIRVYKLANEPVKLLAQYQKAVTNQKSRFELQHDPLLKELLKNPTYQKLIAS